MDAEVPKGSSGLPLHPVGVNAADAPYPGVAAGSCGSAQAVVCVQVALLVLVQIDHKHHSMANSIYWTGGHETGPVVQSLIDCSWTRSPVSTVHIRAR